MAALSDTTNVGLANRFKVSIVPEGFNLGSWQKAEGLDVSWDMPDYRAGDAGNLRWYFPANTKYSPVKLVRAACDDSMAVRDWLNSNSFTFQKSRSQVKIELFDSSGKVPVVTWELKNALPKKWSINSMDAGASTVSVETIEFDHEGFLDDETAIGA
ncbi:MAG: phage tail protein [Jatrophihabitans sp.]